MPPDVSYSVAHASRGGTVTGPISRAFSWMTSDALVCWTKTVQRPVAIPASSTVFWTSFERS